MKEEYNKILTPDAIDFVTDLEKEFGPRRKELLAARVERQTRLDAGEFPDFLKETKIIRETDWTAAPIFDDLSDRRVEITGPTTRKMVINALNSGAKCFMADFEDSNSPIWDNLIDGQSNLYDAVRRSIDFTDPSSGKSYALNEKTATLLVRPRGLHLPENHFKVNGEPITGAFLDFGLYFFHNAKELISQGRTPAFYLPKLEHYLEARLWNDVFIRAQEKLGIPRGSIRATVLIETFVSGFQMDEIIYELREHSAGLNAGRWDWLFAFIKKLRAHPHFVLPDRGLLTMDKDFMRSYTKLLIQTCHRRGVHAMGGMSALIPIKGDAAANEVAMAKVRADKEREVNDGHDGCWVAHPGLVQLAMEIFDKGMPTPNQIYRRIDGGVLAADLMKVPEGVRTEKTLRNNIRVSLIYLESWLRGNGCVPIDNLMEDLATVEISRAQTWQWIRHGATLDDGRIVTKEIFRKMLGEETGHLATTVFSSDPTGLYMAQTILGYVSLKHEFSEFLSLEAYEMLINGNAPEGKS